MAGRVRAFHEVRVGFGGIAPWQAWAADNEWISDRGYVESLVEAIRAEGCDDPLVGFVPPGELVINGTNYRETITSRETNSRHRAVLLEARDSFDGEADVYAPEAVTGFARRLGAMFPRFIGSEYMPDGDVAAGHPAIRHEDVQQLSFADGSLDGYISCEILEHVPSISRTLAEARRVLRQPGALIATFPFASRSMSGVEKAGANPDGSIEYLTAPEYHGNPLGGSGSLVFNIPGWDILDECKNAGFRDARMVVHSSRRYGITGADMAAVLVLKAMT